MLIPAKVADITEIGSWFTSPMAMQQWTGQSLSMPITGHELALALQLDELPSFVWREEHHILGFGQFYQRLGKCHLCRLTINPKFRGRGLITQLLTDLIALGTGQLNISDSSLFVHLDNKKAMTAYRNYGFVETAYPQGNPYSDCLYMTL